MAVFLKRINNTFKMGELVQLEVGSDVEGWKIVGKLGEGAFGAVYVCSKAGKKYALKVCEVPIIPPELVEEI